MASSSPRRKKILELANIKFNIKEPINPEYSSLTNPEKYVEDISMSKAKEIAITEKSGIIIGSDTIVYSDNEILEKPKTIEHMRSMLKSLSANNHKVTTGISIIDLDNNIEISKSLSTIVAMKTITNELLEKYIESGRGFDKAGAYGIQDYAGLFIKDIKGSYDNIVGFPISKFYQIIKKYF